MINIVINIYIRQYLQKYKNAATETRRCNECQNADGR